MEKKNCIEFRPRKKSSKTIKNMRKMQFYLFLGELLIFINLYFLGLRVILSFKLQKKHDYLLKVSCFQRSH